MKRLSEQFPDASQSTVIVILDDTSIAISKRFIQKSNSGHNIFQSILLNLCRNSQNGRQRRVDMSRVGRPIEARWVTAQQFSAIVKSVLGSWCRVQIGPHLNVMFATPTDKAYEIEPSVGLDEWR